MIIVHHLNNSRSQRVLWLLEELEVEYEIQRYERDPETNLAPPELAAVHPLGKSPMVSEDGRTLIESGAIIDFLIRRHGAGRLRPAEGTDELEEYLQWLHYAEGSAMLPLMMKLYMSRLPDGGAALQPRIESELDRHLGYVDRSLEGSDWLVADTFSGADVQMSFVAEIAPLLHPPAATLAGLADFKDRCHARPAYQRALEKGGAYAYA